MSNILHNKSGLVKSCGPPDLFSFLAPALAPPLIPHQLVGPGGLAHELSRQKLGEHGLDVDEGRAVDGVEAADVQRPADGSTSDPQPDGKPEPAVASFLASEWQVPRLRGDESANGCGPHDPAEG